MAIGTYPYDHDMYIPDALTAFVFCLNTFSAILFSTFLYFILTKRIKRTSTIVFLLLTIMQAVGHGVFVVMNWGSFLFLPLSVIVLVVLAISYFKKNNEV